MEREMVFRRHLFSAVAAILVFGLIPVLAASWEPVDERDDKVGTLIHNTIHMSRLAGSPTLEDIAQWKKRGRTSVGLGYHTPPLDFGEGDGRYSASINIVFMSEEYAQRDFEMFAESYVQDDPVSGGRIYLTRSPENPTEKPYVMYMLYRDGVMLRMLAATVKHLEDDETIGLTIPRYRYLVEEARRLGIISDITVPQ
jgi:hypothetical protein